MGLGARFRAALLICLGLCVAAPAAARAAGELASTATPGTALYSAAPEAAGSAVVAGASGNAMLVQRIDTSGNAGTSFSAGTGIGRAVAVQPDGKVVVAGEDSGIVIRRFNADGSTDTSFGTSGTARVSGLTAVRAIVLAPNGDVVVGGSITRADGYSQGAIVRLSSGGGTVGTFGSGGLRALNTGRLSIVNGLAAQTDGKIVYAGQATVNLQTTSGFVGRVNTDGSDDSGFASGGLYTVDSQGSANLLLSAVAVDGSGRIVAVGGSVGQNNTSAIFVRLSAAGGLDTSFGSGGTFRPASSNTFITDNVGVRSVALLADGRIVGAGDFQNNGTRAAALYVVTGSGALDTSVGDKGLVTSSPGEGGGDLNSVAIAPNGNVYGAGTTRVFSAAATGFVNRYNSLGAPLTTAPATTTTTTPVTPTPVMTTPVVTPIPTPVQAPKLAALSVSSLKFSPSFLTPKKSAKLTFTLNRAATITVTLEQKLKGRKKGSKCSKPSKSNVKGKSCSFYAKVSGSKSVAGKAGANSVTFTRKFASHTLKTGSYRATVASGTFKKTLTLSVRSK